MHDIPLARQFEQPVRAPDGHVFPPHHQHRRVINNAVGGAVNFKESSSCQLSFDAVGWTVAANSGHYTRRQHVYGVEFQELYRRASALYGVSTAPLLRALIDDIIQRLIQDISETICGYDYMGRDVCSDWIHRSNHHNCPFEEVHSQPYSVDVDTTVDSVTGGPYAYMAGRPQCDICDGAGCDCCRTTDTEGYTADTSETAHDSESCPSPFCHVVRRLSHLSGQMYDMVNAEEFDFAVARQCVLDMFSDEGK